MEGDESSSPRATDRGSKVVRMIEKYDLNGIGEEMEERWTAAGDERMSLRELADYFNQKVLATAMDENGLQPLEGEVENTNHFDHGFVSGNLLWLSHR